MCLAKAYIERNGERELLMDEVASMEIGESCVILKALLGERQEIAASVRQIDFLSHNIVLNAETR